MGHAPSRGRRIALRNKLARGLPVLGAAALAACSSYEPYYTSTPAPNAPPVITATAPYRLGTGTVESVALLRAPGERASASSGGSIPRRASYRVAVRMDDGSLQLIDQDNSDFQVGDRVRIIGSGRVIRP
jgi:hypothetical protein